MKKPLVICLLTGVLFAGLPLVLHSILPDRLTFSNYRLLDDGMSEGEVRRILGGWNSIGPAADWNLIASWKEKKVTRVAFWSNRYANISVGFDEQGTLRGKIFTGRE